MTCGTSVTSEAEEPFLVVHFWRRVLLQTQCPRVSQPPAQFAPEIFPWVPPGRKAEFRSLHLQPDNTNTGWVPACHQTIRNSKQEGISCQQMFLLGRRACSNCNGSPPLAPVGPRVVESTQSCLTPWILRLGLGFTLLVLTLLLVPTP